MSHICSALGLSGICKSIPCKALTNKYINHTYKCIITKNWLIEKLYLCDYHLKRYNKKLRIAVKPRDEILIIPSELNFVTLINYLEICITKNVDYLPDDCWQVIIQNLSPASKFLARFVCKSWKDMVASISHKEPINFTIESCYPRSYFTELAISYGIKNIDLSKYHFSKTELNWLIDNGAVITTDLLKYAIKTCYYTLVDILISKDIRLEKGYQIKFVAEDIQKLLVINGLAITDNNNVLMAI